MIDSVDVKASLKGNMILNVAKVILGILFPLITFPYATRVLGVDGLGKYNFSSSIASYFSLIAALGFSSYMRRTGSTVRHDKEKFNKLASEVFSLNILSTLLSYCLLFCVLTVSTKLSSYKNLILILSSSMMLTTFGVDWIYSIFEDYLYITIRSFVFHIVSLVLLFVFVKTPNDLVKYTWISVISSAGSNILNFLHARKYCRIRFTFNIDWRQHMPSVMIFWATALAITIYVSSDTTILGFLCGDYEVGLYSVSVKIYSIVKSIVGSVVAVSIPRLCAYLGKGEKENYILIAQDVHNTVVTFTMPALVGIIAFRWEIISFIAGPEYISATTSLALLAVALLFCMLGYFWGQCVLVPNFLEKRTFFATVCSAVINIVLNFILIPVYKQDAAAFTTMLGEGIAFLVCYLEGRKYFKVEKAAAFYGKVVVGSLLIIPIAILVKKITSLDSLRIIIGVIVSVLCYFFFEYIVNNETVVQILVDVKSRISSLNGIRNEDRRKEFNKRRKDL